MSPSRSGTPRANGKRPTPCTVRSPNGKNGSSNGNVSHDGDRKLETCPGINMKLANEEIAFVLGRRGSTKSKIARVSGANMNIDESTMKLTITGTQVAVRRAHEYVKLVLAQRTGPVYIDFAVKRPDLTVVDVPRDCVGYVTGRNGTVLRNLEMEWRTLMFFGKAKGGGGGHQDVEKLAIYGDRRGRAGAELKVLSAVEHKSRGFVIQGDRPRRDFNAGIAPGDDWATETLALKSDDYSYALGKMGSTRKKLAWASGCIVQYIGKVAFFCGTRAQRIRAKDYLRMLLQHKSRDVTYAESPDTRSDCLVLNVPRQCVGFITGYKGKSLRHIEQKSRTFIFAEHSSKRKTARNDITTSTKSAGLTALADSAKVEMDVDDSTRALSPMAGAGPTERLLIFAHDPQAMEHAKDLVEDLIEQKLKDDSRPAGERSRLRGPVDLSDNDSGKYNRGKVGGGGDFGGRRDGYGARCRDRDRGGRSGRSGRDNGYGRAGEGRYYDRDRQRDRSNRRSGYDRDRDDDRGRGVGRDLDQGHGFCERDRGRDRDRWRRSRRLTRSRSHSRSHSRGRKGKEKDQGVLICKTVVQVMICTSVKKVSQLTHIAKTPSKYVSKTK